MAKSDKLYKDSPTVERGEDGAPAIGKKKTVGEDGSSAEMDHGGNDHEESHEAERASMHRRHEEEQKAMHERHGKDMKEMHKRHEKAGKPAENTEKTGGGLIDKVEKDGKE